MNTFNSYNTLPTDRNGYNLYKLKISETEQKFSISSFKNENLFRETSLSYIKPKIKLSTLSKKRFILNHVSNSYENCFSENFFFYLKFLNNNTLSISKANKIFCYLIYFLNKFRLQSISLKKTIRYLSSIYMFNDSEKKIKCLSLALLIKKRIGFYNFIQYLIKNYDKVLKNKKIKNDTLVLKILNKLKIRSFFPVLKHIFFKTYKLRKKKCIIYFLSSILKTQYNVKKKEALYIFSFIKNFFNHEKSQNVNHGFVLLKSLSKNFLFKVVQHDNSFFTFMTAKFGSMSSDFFRYKAAVISCKIIQIINPITIPFFILKVFKISVKLMFACVEKLDKIIKIIDILIGISGNKRILPITWVLKFFDYFIFLINRKKLYDLKICFYAKVFKVLNFYNIKIFFSYFVRKLKEKIFKDNIFLIDILILILKKSNSDFFIEIEYHDLCDVIFKLLQKNFSKKILDPATVNTIKKCHVFFEIILIKFYKIDRSLYFKFFGLLKWELKNGCKKIKIQSIKSIRKLSEVLQRNYFKILMGNINIILCNNLIETDSDILRHVLCAINSIIKNFSTKLTVPPISSIFNHILPVLRKKEKRLEKYLSILFLNIIRKTNLLLYKKEWVKTFILVTDFLKNPSLMTRKYSIILLTKIIEHIGPFEICYLIINNLRNDSCYSNTSLYFILVCTADIFGVQYIIPFLYKNIINFDNTDLSKVLKIFSYILEYLPEFKLTSYIEPLFVILNERFYEKIFLREKVVFLIFSQIFELSYKLGFDISTDKIFKKIWTKIFQSDSKLRPIILHCIEKYIRLRKSKVSLTLFSHGIFHTNDEVRFYHLDILSYFKKKNLFSTNISCGISVFTNPYFFSYKKSPTIEW